MAKKSRTIEKNGLLYSVHSTAINNGTKKIQDIFCPKPTANTLQAYFEAKVLTLDIVCSEFNHGYAITLQSAARRAATSNKMTKTEYDALYNELITPDIMQQAFDDEMDTKKFIDEFIIAEWDERRSVSCENESDEIDGEVDTE